MTIKEEKSKPIGIVKDLLEMLKMNTKHGETRVPTDAWDSINDKIQSYVYTMGRKHKLIPKDTKKKDLTFDQVYNVLVAMIGDNKNNNIYEMMKPYVQTNLFSGKPGNSTFFNSKVENDD